MIDACITVVDHGLFGELAVRLAREVSHVRYNSPWACEFPTINDRWVGRGLPEVEWVEDPYVDAVLTTTDVYCFPDILDAGEQRLLHLLEKPVWGSRTGDTLETDRVAFRQFQEAHDLPVPEYEVIQGYSALVEHLRANDHHCWIKTTSKIRGSMETHEFWSMDQDAYWLDDLKLKLGGPRERVRFIVEEPIESAWESGLDTYSIRGNYPKTPIQGIEIKGKLMLSSAQLRSPTPDFMDEALSILAPELARHDYCNFLSLEFRKDILTDPCFSADTEILTEAGWKLFPALSPVDRVATLNTDTWQIEYQVPTRHTGFLYTGDMIWIGNRKPDLELLVTPNHGVWGQMEGKGPLRCVQADKVPYSFYIPRTGRWNGLECPRFELPAYHNDWMSGTGRKLHRSVQKPPIDLPMDDWLRFLAIYLAEGSSTQWVVTISQTKQVSEMGAILEKLPWTWSRSDVGWRCSDVQLAHYLQQFGNRYEKFVPCWIKNLSPRQIDLFLSAYCLGDGTMQHGARKISTPSKQTADDLQELFLKAGSLADVRLHRFKGKICALSNTPCQHDSYRVTERRKRQKLAVEGWSMKRHSHHLRRQAYSGMVYDVEVPNHTVYVRRNGKACWSSNCMRAPNPGLGVEMEMIRNLGEIIYHGAHGDLIEPDFEFEYGIQAAIFHDHEEDAWKQFPLDDDVRRWVKLMEFAYIDGLYQIIPRPPHGQKIGWLLGVGHSIEEAAQHLYENADRLKDYPFDIKLDALEDAVDQAHALQDEGAAFADQPIPEPDEIREDAQ